MVLGSGCFDGLHGGHARYLSALKALARADEAVNVAVAPDDYIDTHKHRKPRWPQDERFRTLLECGVVPLYQSSQSVAQLILDEQPRLFVKGQDWAGKLPADVVMACQEVGALIVFVDTPGVHTSEAIG